MAADVYDLLQQELGIAAASPPAADPSAFSGRLAMGTRDVAQGAAQGLPGLLYDAAGNLINLGIKGVGALTGADVQPYLVRPAATNVDLALNKAGLPPEGDPNAVGRIIRGTTAGLSSVPAGMALGAIAPAATTASAVGGALEAAPVAQAVGGAAGAASSLETDKIRQTNPMLASFIDTATSLAAAGSTAGLAKLLNAPGLPADVAAWAQLARERYGIPLTAADMTQVPSLRSLADVNRQLPFSGARTADQAVQDATTQAVSNTIGENTPRLTKSTMTDARQRMRDEFDRIGGATTVSADDPLIADLGQIESEARSATGFTKGSPMPPQMGSIQNQIDNLQNIFAAHDGTIPGSVYQDLTKKGTPLYTIANNPDPVIGQYGQRIEDALFNAWERSAPPDEVANLRDTRWQYKNMKTVEPLVEKSPTGQISPNLLSGAVQRNFDDLAYSGAGDLGNLADISKLFLGKPPDSGTPMRGTAMMALTHPLVAAATLPITIPVNQVLGRTLRSDWLADRLLQNSLGGPRVSIPPSLGAAAAAFPMGQRQQQNDPYADLQSLLR
jgi:hypothetical protein